MTTLLVRDQCRPLKPGVFCARKRREESRIDRQPVTSDLASPADRAASRHTTGFATLFPIVQDKVGIELDVDLGTLCARFELRQQDRDFMVALG